MNNAIKKYKRVGECQPDKCNAFCCTKGSMIFFEAANKLDYDFYENFGYEIKVMGERAYVFSKQPCNKLKNGKCMRYKNRPNTCRNFPLSPEQPMFKMAKAHGCTYDFEEIE